MRSAPSTQPMYQSGCDADVTAVTAMSLRNGPYTQIGLIWASPPRPAITPAVMNINPTDFIAKAGQARMPTTLCSVRSPPGYCVCRCRQTSARWMPINVAIAAGRIRMCST
jgi:hypothetical protein